MSVRIPLSRLLLVLALWMLATAAGCALIYLDTHGYATLESQPRRTHAPRPPRASTAPPPR
jgi:hypothetical protein